MNDEIKKPTFVLVDGSNYVYRAFYAIQDLSNSKGFPTNAIYGFTTMLMKLLRDVKPDYIAVAFDVKGPTFRHESYEQYKATRKATPDALIPQIPFIKDIVRGFSIPVLEKQGIEADDIIGTLAKRHAEKGMKILVVSGDKDLMQLVADDIIMVDTMKDKIYDVKAVKDRFGVGPEKVVEILGLIGDTSDNIPGVPGIGPKNALRLIEEFGSIEEIVKNVDRIRNANAKKNIREFAEQAKMSRELAIIRTDMEIDFDLESCRYTGPDTNVLKQLYREFEFSSLLQELRSEEETIQGRYRLIRSMDDLMSLVEKLKRTSEFSLDIITTSDTPMQSDIVGLSICPRQGEAFYIPLRNEVPLLPLNISASDKKEREELFKEGEALKPLAQFFSHKQIKKHAHDMKNILITLGRRGIELANPGCDTMVASYVLNPAKHNFNLAEVARDQLHIQIVESKDLVGSGIKAIPFTDVPVEKAMDYSCRRADAVMGLASTLCEKIIGEGFDDLFYCIEMPLVSILAGMEKKGVLLDIKLLGDMSKEIEQLMSLSEEKIYHLAGEKFNINSPKQLQVILFDKIGLPKGKKTKDGYSTDVDVLTNLSISHELPAEILAYRSLAKLKSTYIDSLPALVNKETGRVHTSYNQTVTATGRLSSSNPNLQNIPVRTLEGKRIRQAFIAPEGWEIVSADYSQIELRVLAHLSGDKTLIAAFTSGEDIHSRTASDLFGVFPTMVNAEMRRQAKVINFGILYGMSAFGLSRELGLNQKLAQAYIDEYFKKYEGVKFYLDEILRKARQDGFVTTLMNRRRYLSELQNSNAAVRQFAERMAINTPIQGTAADLIKMAMINIAKRFKGENLSSCMIMQVHDELVFEVPLPEKEKVMAVIKEEMEGVFELRVPLKVDCAAGKNWDEAH